MRLSRGRPNVNARMRVRLSTQVIRLISTGAASGAKLSRLGVCCGGSTPTPPRLQRATLAAGCACSGPRSYLELELVLEPGALVMPGPRPACQGLSVSRVITVCDPAFASVGSPHHGTASEQLRIICLHTVCVRPARRPSGHCHARPSARVSSTGLETQGPEASLLLLQRNLVYAPLRSAHHRGPSQLAGSLAPRKEKTCA